MTTKPRYDLSLPAAGNAALILEHRIAAWFDAGRGVAGSDADAKSLHRFRLEGKRLRYTMELFAPCYGKTMDRYLGLLRKSQTWLGDFNDCAAAGRLLGEITIAEADRRKAAKFLERRAAKLHGSFRNFWKEELDVPGAERRWLGYAKRPRK